MKRLIKVFVLEKLDVVTNIALIAVACIIGYRFLRARAPSENPLPASVQVGDQLPRLAAYDWKSHARTLILALQDGCRFCEESLPFYRKLAELENSNQTDAHLIAVFPDAPAAVRRHLATQQLAIEAFAGVELSQVKAAGTPTLILVDRQGRASGVWIGALAATAEAEVVTAIKRARAKRPLNGADEDRNSPVALAN